MSSEKRDASPEASPLKGPAPKAIPEDTSDVAFEDGIPLSPMAGDQSVQFISAAPANGDAKVEIGDSGGTAPTFVGLGKEELMKYANDPFWVKLRWFLFILFWVLWLAMLVGAIVIIVLAPRCAEKKIVPETYYQIKAADLIKDSKIDENTKVLKDLGIQNIIIADALQHQLNEPEAVTDFDKFEDGLNEDLLTQAINGLREHGIKILLQIIPNHSGTSHEWFNETSSSNKYVRKPYDEVKDSVWTTQDRKHNSWTQDVRAGFENTAYLQQFSGSIADLNFANPDVVEAFSETVKLWKGRSIDGFQIPKASYLRENLGSLMDMSATKNQPENVQTFNKMFKPSQQVPVVVELDDASDETIQEYVKKGMIPLLKTNVSSSENIKDALEALNNNPTAVINLSKPSGTPQKARILNLLASAIGSHSLVAQGSTGSDGDQFLEKLVQFQKEHPRGKGAQVSFATNNKVVAALRSDGDDLLALANLGVSSETFNPATFNMTVAGKGKVILSTSTSAAVGHEVEGAIPIDGNTGIIIKFEKPEETP